MEETIPAKKPKKNPKSSIPRYKKKIPQITTEQMIEVDRLMIEEYHIELIQMMENAGRCLALLAKEKFLKNKAKKKTVVVLAGTGGNGGGAMVAARRLSSWGYDVKVFATDFENMTPIPFHQFDILKRMGISLIGVEGLKDLEKPDLILDGIIGYSLQGNPRGSAAEMIHWANTQKCPIVALDAPSGLDLTSGKLYEPAIKASATLTLALPKIGLFDKAIKDHRGQLFLGDISVPPSLYAKPTLDIKVKPSIFRDRDIIRID